MADLDFPTAPTVGQTYTAPNGQTYVWDGVTWVVSHAAGGDLTGFYPDPTIGANKVLRTALATTLQAAIPPTPDDPVDTGKVATVSGGITVWATPQGAPLGPAGGDLTGTYPDPTIRNEAVTAAAIADGAVTFPKLATDSVGVLAIIDGAVDRAKIAANAWLSPIPTGADVGKVLTVNTGPVLAWTSGAGGVVIGPSAPGSPTVGQLWWRTTDGNLYIYYDDGSSAQFVPAMASVGKLVGGQFYLVAGALAGAPTASLALGFYVAALAFTLPSGLTGSQAKAEVAATAQTDLDVLVNDVSKGTIRFAAGATVATFLWTSAVALVVGDRIEVRAPATPDATLADIAWTLKGAL